MQKEKKRDIRNILILWLIFALIIAILVRGKYLYGSTMDWDSQHFNFANYFRSLFYETKQFFPSFAFNIGAGQNIYNFSYYGLFSPMYLISYLFPFLNMATYTIIASILSILITITLFYKWLRTHKFSSNISLLVSFLFLTSAPLILHSHRHIMFINYLPFLMWALFSVDKYFITNKRLGLVFSTFLLILSSYYYSIPSLLVIIIYGIFLYLKQNSKITLKSFFSQITAFIFPLIIAVFLASFLLIPTLYTILNGRISLSSNTNLFTLIFPQIHLDYLIFSSYCLGLTSIGIIGILSALISPKKENKFLGLIFSILCLFPIFIYILNGFLYLNAKVLIPFLPLCCYLVAIFFQNLASKNINIKQLIILSLIVSLLAIFNYWPSYYLYLIDIFILILTIIYYIKKKHYLPLVMWLIITSFINLGIANYNDELLSIDDYKYLYNSNITKLWQEIEDPEVYRATNLIEPLATSNLIPNLNYYSSSLYSSNYNAYYKEFYQNIFNNEIKYRNYLMLSAVTNPLFNTYMGIKYLITDQKAPIGYEKISSKGPYSLYQNNNVLPIGYVNQNQMSETEFNKLSYPQRIEALFKYSITKSPDTTNFQSTIQEYPLKFFLINNPNLQVKSLNDGYELNVLDNVTFNLTLPEKLTNQLLFIDFNMDYEESCQNGDTSITINDIQNTLSCRSWKFKNENNTFNYVISASNLSELAIKITKGKYHISNIKTYIMSYDEVLNQISKVDKFIIDPQTTKGDTISGHLKTTGGYFNLSIPYDKGFKIYVNDKLQDYELTNLAFIGFPIASGEYDIKIIYEAPYQKVGLIFSAIGIIFTISIGYIDKKRGRKKCTKI